MRKSSKLAYTCAYSEYKWTMKCKRIWIKCCSLLVHVYTQILTNTTSNHVFTTWSTKQMNMLKISYMKKHGNKIGVLEIVTNTWTILQITKTWWSSHQTSLIAVHQMCVHQVHVQAPPRHQLSHVLWVPAPTSKTHGGNFGTHFLLGPWGLAL